jgi:hypothetical protein
MTIATSAYFQVPRTWHIFFQYFPFNLCLSLVVRFASYKTNKKTQMVGSWFLIQSDDLCLLIEELSLFTFRVMI